MSVPHTKLGNMGRPSTLPTLAQARPELVLDWHPDNIKTPDTVSIGSKYRALWKCRTTITYQGQPRDCRYEWPTAVQNRAQAGHGCPACKGKAATDWNSLATLRPDLAAQWHPDNDLTPHQVTTGSGYVATWQCPDCPNTWPTSVDKRTNRNHGCPDCSAAGNATPTNNFALLGDPEVVADWHPTKNAQSPDQYRPHSNAVVWWKCRTTITYQGHPRACGHEWEQNINARNGRAGCPACSGYAAADWNNLTVTHPHLIPDWHPDNNLRPHEVTFGVHASVQWRCHNVVSKFGIDEPCGYAWSAQVFNRSAGKGCPACAGHVATEWNNLGVLHPALAAEWDPSNTLTPYEVTPGTNFHAAWVCSNTATTPLGEIKCGHRWRTKPSNRVLGTGCKRCKMWATSKDEIFLASELAAFYTIDTTSTRIQGATQAWRCDITIPDIKVIVEYDGSYWHLNKTERDTRKTTDLHAAGWTVIRAREHPLPPITTNDVTCHTGKHKKAADTVLQRIADLTGTPALGLQDYLASTDLTNAANAEQQMNDLRELGIANRARKQPTEPPEAAQATQQEGVSATPQEAA